MWVGRKRSLGHEFLQTALYLCHKRSLKVGRDTLLFTIFSQFPRNSKSNFIITLNHNRFLKYNWLNKWDDILDPIHAALFSKLLKDVWCSDANVVLQPAEDGWMVMLKHSEDEWIVFLRCGEKGWMVRLCHGIKERAEDGWLTFSVLVDLRTDRTNIFR